MSDTKITKLPAPKPTPRGEQLQARIFPAADAKANLERRYLVKGWLDADSVTVLFGDSNTGKSFKALDLCRAISAGERWHGRRVNKCRVLYVACEGGGGIQNRLAALGDLPDGFDVMPGHINLRDRGDATALAQVIDAGGYGLVVIDTLARAMSGGDENSSADMGALLAGVEHIRQANRASVLLIHHSGKDSSRGARGHSSLRAAVDAEIELVKDKNGVATATVMKARDGATGATFSYRLAEVELGTDQDGDRVTSCVIERCDTPAKAPVKKLNAASRDLLRIAQSHDHGEGVHKETARAEFFQKRIVSSATPEKEAEAKRKAFTRAVETLRDACLIDTNNDLIFVTWTGRTNPDMSRTVQPDNLGTDTGRTGQPPLRGCPLSGPSKSQTKSKKQKSEIPTLEEFE